MVITISDIHREKTTITFNYYTNANLQSVCYLMTMAGAKERTILMGNKHKEVGEFGRVDPSKSYLVQCFVGQDVSKDSAVFFSQSSPIEIPREPREQVWNIVITVFIFVFLLGGVIGLVLLFKNPDLFDFFFTPYG